MCKRLKLKRNIRNKKKDGINWNREKLKVVKMSKGNFFLNEERMRNGGEKSKSELRKYD